ncbi:DUF6776 family protein [Pseudoxanthomonas dokdonensis]|uniref:Membrane protein n=1 Tax=Pseudoxanthomonas dokdonensis TaxID=344882 RepID=A0A0R0CQ67_9GAMM|nr:DUF6776 family protein [Pseudoxanthomonas dokdonensis]KRG71600.1 membrane protein [Pseudoxanthomonas dokdonensis]
MAAIPVSRFQIVERRQRRRWPWLLALALVWLLSLLAAWQLASWRAAPSLGRVSEQLRQSRADAARDAQALKKLQQQQATLTLSDRISRAANSQVQQTLAERDEEIAGLRADVAFYERLVGATGQRKGLSVHQAEFSPSDAGAWRYRIVLTQTLNRGAVSQGQMQFAVEGVADGKLQTLDWKQLHQRREWPGQDYSFRYFQQLDGNVMLPPDFTPQRVKVRLHGGDVAVEQTFDWTLATSAGGT